LLSGAQGKYLVTIAGCNDCHTPDYLPTDGQVPESQWLIGDSVGWRGPWGTTYAPNLRLVIKRLDEDQWVAYARNLKTRPPMPWSSLNQFRESDLRSVYRYANKIEGQVLIRAREGKGHESRPDPLPPLSRSSTRRRRVVTKSSPVP
jgi:mono/diheme cytochrome c family protein